MTNRINAGERELQRLLDGRMISPSGADWVVAAADPFHDKPLANLCGYPQEGVNGQSIVLKIPYQFTLSAPNTLLPGETWQFMLTTYPWLCGAVGAPQVLVPYVLRGNVLSNAGATSPPNDQAHHVSVYRGRDGTNLGPFNVFDVGNSPDVTGISLEPQHTIGPHRCVAAGVEVYDTTAVIDRQGTCTVWRQNTNTFDKTTYQHVEVVPPGLGINSWGNFSGVIVRRPPQNISEANKLAGTKSWKSDDGCYLVETLNSNDITIKQADDTQPIMLRQDISAGQRTAGASTQILSGPLNVENFGVGTSVRYPQLLYDFQPYNMSGCFFTGLRPSATFLIRCVFYIERFPTPDESDIVLLTKPSATYDPMALEIYDHMLHRMPPGVPVADNGLGEWFYEGIKSAASAIFPGVTRFLGMNKPPQNPMPNSTAAIKYPKALPPTKPLKPANPGPKKPKKSQVTAEVLKLIRQKQSSGQTLSNKEKAILQANGK